MTEITVATLSSEEAEREIPKGAQEVFLLLAGAAFVLLAAFVIAFGYWGENVVAGLDQVCAEAVFDAANKLRTQGHDELAIQRFRQAFAGRFKDESRRYMCGRALGDLLTKRQRYDEAIEIYQALPEAAFSTPGAYAGYVDALWRQGMLAEAQRLGSVWCDMAQRAGEAQQIEWANALLLRIAEAEARYEDAITYGQAAVAANPGSDAGLLLSQLLARQGRIDEARTALGAFLAASQNEKLKLDAVQFKAKLDAPAAGTSAPAS